MKKLTIIGYPVSHSLSPAMHNFISEKLGAPYVYTATEVKPGEVGKAVMRLRDEGICGFNVTAPHKFGIMNYLDEISEQAKRYGSVNTVVNRGGRLIGYNTDADGFYMSLLHNGIDVSGRHILVLGAGGAAQPTVLKLAESGAETITVINRTREKAEALKQYVRDCTGFNISTCAERSRYDIVVNCTSLGMGENKDMCPLSDFSVIDEASAAVDMIYNPAETLFLKRAGEAGAKTLNGRGMLVFQGIAAYRLFTGIDLPVGIADEIMNEVF